MLMVGASAFSQNKFKKFFSRVDSVLRVKYERVTYDTQYICRPDRRLLLRVRGNLSGNSFRYKNTQGENDSHAHISTDLRGTISLGVSYMGIAASYSINPGKISGSNKGAIVGTISNGTGIQIKDCSVYGSTLLY